MSSTNYTTTPGPDRPIETSDSTKTSSGGETNYGDRSVYGTANESGYSGQQQSGNFAGQQQSGDYAQSGLGEGRSAGRLATETGLDSGNTGLSGGYSGSTDTGLGSGNTGHHHHHHHHAGSAGTALGSGGAGYAAQSTGGNFNDRSDVPLRSDAQSERLPGSTDDNYRSESRNVPFQNSTGRGDEAAGVPASGREFTAGHAHTGAEAPANTAYGRGTGEPLADTAGQSYGRSAPGGDNTGDNFGRRVNDGVHDNQSIDKRTTDTNDLIDQKTKSVPGINTHDNVVGSGTGTGSSAHQGEAGGLHKDTTSSTDGTEKTSLLQKIKNII